MIFQIDMFIMSQRFSQDSLNKSKFLTQQINFDEEPTQEEIIERAQELGINDLGLAKQSLVKQLEPQWKPYMNRSQQVFYINLEERVAYRDHPIDMEFKITYALRNKLKTPVFKQYEIQQISGSIAMVESEIKKYLNTRSLNIVYEQSEEESVRKNTNLSNQEEQEMYEAELQAYIEANNEELENYRIELQQKMKVQVNDYRKAKEGQFIIRNKRHEANIQEIKTNRLKEVAAQFQAEWLARNQSNYTKAIETTKQELQKKAQKFQDLLQKQIDAIQNMQKVRLSQKDLKITNRQKIIRQKIATQTDFTHSLNLQLKQKANRELCSAVDKYQLEARQLVGNRINYQQRVERNFCEIQELVSDNKLNKKRLPIFKSQLHQKRQLSQKDEERLMQQLQTNQQIWCRKEELKYQYRQQVKGSLSLRLMKRIL